MKEEYKTRVEQAVDNFMAGCNCSQAVMAAFADIYGIDTQTAMRLTSGFGGGIGRMRQTCGAACSMFMLAGLAGGTDRPGDRERQNQNFKTVQELAAGFKDAHGSIVCAEILAGDKLREEKEHLTPHIAECCRKRACAARVESAALLFARYLEEQTA